MVGDGRQWLPPSVKAIFDGIDELGEGQPLEPKRGRIYLDEKTGCPVIEGFVWTTNEQMDRTMIEACLLGSSSDHRRFGVWSDEGHYDL